MFAAYWVEDIPLDSAERVADIAGLGIDADRRALLDGLASGEGADLLRREVDASMHDCGVGSLLSCPRAAA